ncbi:MAG: murein biosynthesis integral membrane protein MurJ [Rhodospirillaceae bacterium]
MSSPSLLKGIGTVGFFTLGSRITGFVRDMLQAALLGAGDAAAAFIVAFRIPNLFRSLFAEGAFSAGFVPLFTAMHEGDGHEKAMAFAREAAAVLMLALAAFSALVIAFMPAVVFLIAPGFADNAALMDQAVKLSRIAFPYLFFISLASLQSGILNALHIFAAPAAAPILLNITVIGFLAGATLIDQGRAEAMAWGVSAAGLVQFLWLGWHCRRAGAALGLGRPRLSNDVKLLLKRMLPVAIGAGVYQLNMFASTIIASLVSVGAVSWLYYADRVNQLPVGIVGVAVGIVLLPMLSRQIRAGNEEAALANQNRAIEFSLLLTIPASVGIALLAEPITATLFERGQFMPSDREAVAAALFTFSFALPAYVLNKALTPGFFGRHDTATPVKVAAAAFIVNLAASLALIRVYGHVGIALASSISAWLNAGTLYVILARRGHIKPDARLKKRLPRLLLATAVMGGAVWLALRWALDIAGPVFGPPQAAAGPEVMRIYVLAPVIALGGLVFLAGIFLFGAADRSDLKQFKRGA